MAFNNKQKRTLVAEINVVPYIDVMLVLLIVFMVTAPLLTTGVKVDLPKATAQPVEDKEPIEVGIDKDGVYHLNLGNGKSQPEAVDVIVERVRKVLNEKPDTPVLVRADRTIDYGTVVGLMARLQAAGVKGVGLVTDPPSGRR
ncbi:MAG: protein TolR [Gammaproteobacteria bacterium]|nr:protein TolR [Gammaproteobacteria bacterium]MBK8134083.1 protein TolR [Gammaproteobacteria bacterium]